MPNWCYTDMYIKGSKEEVKRLQELLHKWISKNQVNSPKYAYLGDNWLGNVVHGAGFKTSDEAGDGYKCRGYIEYLGEVTKFKGEGNQYYIEVQYESAWYSMHEMWYAILEKYAPSCDMIWYAEEPGCAIYETNDTDELFFKGTYVVSCYLEDNTPLEKLFKTGGCITSAELEKKLSKILGKYSLPVLIDKANHMDLGDYQDFHIYKIEYSYA